MTCIINLYAGPGTGKSTIAAKTFAQMKEAGRSVELVQEYVKKWAWEDRKPVNYDQFYFFGKQCRAESALLGKVDFIITDAPVLLTSYYAQVYGTPEQAVLFRSMLLAYRRMLTDDGHQVSDFWLNRVKPYDPRGRFQSEDQAKQVDVEMKRYLAEMGIAARMIDADQNAADSIVGLSD